MSTSSEATATQNHLPSQSGSVRYVYRWDKCGRKGQRCRVTARGTLNSCRVVFDDGHVMITSRNALRRE